MESEFKVNLTRLNQLVKLYMCLNIPKTYSFIHFAKCELAIVILETKNDISIYNKEWLKV